MTAAIQATEAALRAELHDLAGAWPPVVCFANDWNSDPTSKHHIMRAYAEHADVLWVESAGMRRPRLSSLMDLRRIAGRVRSSAGGVRREPGRVRVASPLGLPLPGHPLATRLNRRLYHRAVRRGLRGLDGRPPLVWVYTPTVAPYLDGLDRAGLVYHCVDRWWAFGDYDERVMRACHERLCREADVVFASAAALLADCREHTDAAYPLPHGVEWAHFAAAALAPPPRPADIAGIRTPILGFFGLLHEWLDQDVIAALAAALPETTIVLIGRVQVDVTRLVGLPNVRLLGQKPYAELPAYAAAFDVALIPFVINQLTVAVNPIKLREYLSAGLPVVASALPEVALLADNPLVRTAATLEEFVSATREALGSPREPAALREAALAMARESWLGRCVEMAQLVRRHCRV